MLDVMWVFITNSINLKQEKEVHFMDIYGPAFRIQLATSSSFFQGKIDTPSSSLIFGFVICLFSIFLLWNVKLYDSNTR